MSNNYINRCEDEEIIDIMQDIMNSKRWQANTASEHILIKLMELRNTPLQTYEASRKDIEMFYEEWKKES